MLSHTEQKQRRTLRLHWCTGTSFTLISKQGQRAACWALVVEKFINSGPMPLWFSIHSDRAMMITIATCVKRSVGEWSRRTFPNFAGLPSEIGPRVVHLKVAVLQLLHRRYAD
jgi:hypothetical protein